MINNRVQPSDLTGIYKDIAEVIGLEATFLLHKEFQGQQVTFPKKLYTKAYILQQLQQEKQPISIRTIASKYGYTERRIRQILKETERFIMTGDENTN